MNSSNEILTVSGEPEKEENVWAKKMLFAWTHVLGSAAAVSCFSNRKFPVSSPRRCRNLHKVKSAESSMCSMGLRRME